MIYFAQQESRTGPIKIGSAINPKKRLKEIQLTSPNPLVILKIIPGGRGKELGIHYHFQHLHSHGEWFKPEKELLDFIENPFDVPEIEPKAKPIYPPTRYDNLNPDELLTVDEVAKILKVNASLVRRYCREGRLGQSVRGRWLISIEDIDRFQNIPRKRGNPEFGEGYYKSRISIYRPDLIKG